jgi:tRNA pseudouridine38-40 synthase
MSAVPSCSPLADSQAPGTSPSGLQRIALVVQYLGTHFHGWQRQPNQRTVQEDLETTLAAIAHHRVVAHAAGRTDAGVHAAAQVVHFETDSVIPAHRWADVLNSRLPDDILIRGSAAVPAHWHARFSASWRRYRYTLFTDRCPNLFVRPFAWHYYHAPLNEVAMLAALRPLLGRHHLSAFHRAGSARPHSWLDVQDVSCIRRGAFVEIEVQASGFLYGMMRLLVGLLVQVGAGLRTPESFTELWMRERREEVKYAAPAKGLCLLRVGYPDHPFQPDIWYDTQPRLLFPERGWLDSLSLEGAPQELSFMPAS